MPDVAAKLLRDEDEMGDTLKVVDLAEGRTGREVIELIGHPDHVMCGSMS